MKLCLRNLQRLRSWAPLWGVGLTVIATNAQAAECSSVLSGRVIYGAGGSAVTPTLKNVAVALQTLSDSDKITIAYNDTGGACGGYGYWRTPSASSSLSFRYWGADGVESTCTATQDKIQFAHMGNTPALCPGDVPIPSGAARFVAPVQTTNIITHYDSAQATISAEALYYIFGFGPGASGKSVSPWTDKSAVFVRTASSFVHQLVASSIQVPAASFQLPGTNFLSTNGGIVNAIDKWGDTVGNDPNKTLGYVSGSNAQAGEDNKQIKTLAYQHFGQSCAYLPDSSSILRDKANVRSGQYWLWTPAWFYSQVDAQGLPTNADVSLLISWFQGTATPPGGIDIQQIIVESGDVPLCAMQAIRPDGDLSAIQSYAPSAPCNGWFEYNAAGQTQHQACSQTSDCTGSGEVCRFGYCEAY